MNLPEPRKGNMWIGAAYHYFGRVQFYPNIPGFLMVAATFWHTTGSVYLNIPLSMIILLSVITALGLLALEYFIVTPSLIAYGNKLLREQNPVLEEIKELRKEITELKNDRTRPL